LVFFVSQFDLLNLLVLVVKLSLISFSVLALCNHVEVRVFMRVALVFFFLFFLFTIVVVVLDFQLLFISFTLFLATFFVCRSIEISLFLELSESVNLLVSHVEEFVGVFELVVNHWKYQIFRGPKLRVNLTKTFVEDRYL
jgi:hypothetical protein